MILYIRSRIVDTSIQKSFKKYFTVISLQHLTFKPRPHKRPTYVYMTEYFILIHFGQLFSNFQHKKINFQWKFSIFPEGLFLITCDIEVQCSRDDGGNYSNLPYGNNGTRNTLRYI